MDKKLLVYVVLWMKVHVQRQWILRFHWKRILLKLHKYDSRSENNFTMHKRVLWFLSCEPSIRKSQPQLYCQSITFPYSATTTAERNISLDEHLYCLFTELYVPFYQPSCQNNVHLAIICKYVAAKILRKRRKYTIKPKRKYSLINRNKCRHYS